LRDRDIERENVERRKKERREIHRLGGRGRQINR
jgi:hypothetical protein